MITDATYYQNAKLFIPNNKDLNAQPEGAPSVISILEIAIDKYEPELLLNAFGISIYDELETALAKLPFVTDTEPPSLETAEQKWIDLVNGTDYTIGSKTYRWEGLKGVSKQSVCAFFVKCKYMQDNEHTYTTVGMVQNEPQGAVNVNPISHYVSVWSEFLQKYQKYDCDAVKVSLYQYMKDTEVFPVTQFKFYKPINRFGI